MFTITINVSAPGLESVLSRIEHRMESLESNMAAIDDAITTLTAQVAANTDVIGSAEVLINGFSARLDAAVAAATAAGATPAELKAVTDLSAALKAKDDELAAAVAANTPPPVA